MPLPEVLIWQRIRAHGFRRQHALGPFILDFYRPSDRLCIEIDGQQHDLARDARRDACLTDKDVRTIRIPATAVLNDPDAVAEFILSLEILPRSRERGTARSVVEGARTRAAPTV